MEKNPGEGTHGVIDYLPALCEKNGYRKDCLAVSQMGS